MDLSVVSSMESACYLPQYFVNYNNQVITPAVHEEFLLYFSVQRALLFFLAEIIQYQLSYRLRCFIFITAINHQHKFAAR